MKARAVSTVQPSRKPFGAALGDLLREGDYTTSTGNVNWHAFARELDGYVYETLRKAVSGERWPSVGLMEECARVLRVRPDYFAEYRIDQARRLYDVREVGFEKALSNLESWVRERSDGSERKRG